ncbi:FRG1-like family-domain-containing protein [Pseudomassariella vexata]|uniref:FRG1-like family-domain-containing protein n=1 Tax=Pseudomassariella vexata TaxID=1141098 RepID=A0A1Y2D6F3_9PEZI|nr:FRG1-like family-domain-containing protein [Pseudomassariella vexata]ORY54850.1 FRG1-like family-domain-containing protein [Pseudomassariella vexata]
MVKPLSFKGDKKPKKRKRTEAEAPNPEAESSEVALARAEEEPENDDSWVSAEALSDVVGPIMFVLPTEPATCLACDANGKVFTDPIVNIVDANPSSAEPHDVRQVWVANKISGTENYRFKGRYGKYLSCDKYGILSATSEAVSPPETWTVIPTADTPGTFQLQTMRETFLTIKESTKVNAGPEARGDATEITFDTTVRLRMQARFKPKFKASKEEKAKEKISRKELEDAVGRRLEEDEVRKLKRARREGDYHEQILMLKVKNKHDKYG